MSAAFPEGIAMKKLIDVLTVIMLAAAFIIAYVTGFVSTGSDGSPALATGTLAIISILGVIVLLVVGTASSAAVRAKSNTFTKSFTGLFTVQAVSVVGMITIMLFLLLGMFPLTNTVIRTLYIIFAMIGVVGYVDALLYTDALMADEESEESDEEDDEESEEEPEYTL